MGTPDGQKGFVTYRSASERKEYGQTFQANANRACKSLYSGGYEAEDGNDDQPDTKKNFIVGDGWGATVCL